MKLIAIDMDGTLLSTKHVISDENKEAIKKAQAANHIVVISTGRSLHDAQEILKKAKLDCPIITGNGSISHHKNELIRTMFMPKEPLKEMVTFLNEHELYYEVYTREGIRFLPQGKDILIEEFQKMQESGADLPVTDVTHIIDRQFGQHGWSYLDQAGAEFVASLDVYKIYIFSFDQKKLQKAKDSLAQGNDLSSTVSERNNFEIAHKDSSKGNALRHLAEHLNVPIEHTVAIGDNYNDVSMFEVAGVSIAMGNAEADVKAQSTHSTLTNDENGVAHAIHTYILN